VVISSDPAGNARRTTIDGLGRMTKVEENPTGLDYLTQYTYNALDDLTVVTQAQVSPLPTQTRTFSWNMRGWLLSATNPEVNNAATTWSYDNNGNQVYRQDARGIGTCYSYL